MTWVYSLFHLAKIPEINGGSLRAILEGFFPDVVFDVYAKAYSIIAVLGVIGLLQEFIKLLFSLEHQWIFIEWKIGAHVVPNLIGFPALFWLEIFGEVFGILSEVYELPNVVSHFLGNSVFFSGFRTFIDDCHFPLGLLVISGIAVFHLPRRVNTLFQLFLDSRLVLKLIEVLQFNHLELSSAHDVLKFQFVTLRTELSAGVWERKDRVGPSHEVSVEFPPDHWHVVSDLGEHKEYQAWEYHLRQ